MGKPFTIAEVGRLTGLPTHTLRFYESQFPQLLTVDRTPGGHRQYRAEHVANLRRVLVLLRDEKCSLREARERLGETPREPVPPAIEPAPAGPYASDLNVALRQVLDRLGDLCRRNDRLDALLERLCRESDKVGRDALLAQIADCRRETRATQRLYETVLSRHGGPRPC